MKCCCRSGCSSGFLFLVLCVCVHLFHESVYAAVLSRMNTLYSSMKQLTFACTHSALTYFTGENGCKFLCFFLFGFAFRFDLVLVVLDVTMQYIFPIFFLPLFVSLPHSSLMHSYISAGVHCLLLLLLIMFSFSFFHSTFVTRSSFLLVAFSFCLLLTVHLCRYCCCCSIICFVFFGCEYVVLVLCMYGCGC